MVKLDAYTLKWIAIIGMVLNHAVFAFFEVLPLWLMLPMYMTGGLTFPIMAFFVVEGYRHTSNLKGYMLRLFIFGLISQPFHILVFRQFMPNILFTIILSLVVLVLNDKIKIRPLFWLVFVFVNLVSLLVFMDWFVIGIIMVLMYHKIGNENKRRMMPSIVASIFFIVFTAFGIVGLNMVGSEAMIYQMDGIVMYGDINYWYASATFFIGCIAAGFLLKGYNGDRGKRMKWAFYVSYPLHLAVLGGLSLVLGLIDLSLIGL